MLCGVFDERSFNMKKKERFVEGIREVLIAMGFFVQNANELQFECWRRLDSAAKNHRSAHHPV